ncbi:PAS domain S-box protein [Methanoregula sp.]|uniref:PAS domain-containing protein n=1 Tax=Methanoregula sp. TaxID=2052170 RepID=UPI003562A1BF
MPPVPSLEDELPLLKISVDQSSDEVFWLDFAGNVLYVNDAACRITGYSREELCAMKIAGLDPGMSPGAWEASVADLREKKTQFITSRHQCKDGRFIDVDILAIYVNQGDREFSFAYVRDITERKQAEALLRETDRKYHLLADHVHDVIWTTGRDLHFTYFSPSVMALRGLTPEEAMAEMWQDALTPNSYRALRESREQGLAAWRSGGSVPRNIVMELEFRCKDGSTVWTEMAITPIFDKDRTPDGAVGIIRDISQRRLMEQSLRESHAKLRTVLDNLPDLVLVHRDGIILYVNPPMIENMGVSPEEVLNTPILDYIPARFHARITAAIRERKENGPHEPYEIEVESPVKGHRVVLIRGSVIEFNGSPAVLTVLTDVTEQKRAEDALRESEEKFRSFVENANDIVFSLTPDGITSYVSPNWTEILGHDTAEIIGKPVRHIHPDDLPRVREFIRQSVATRKKASGIEYRIQHKDGTWQWHTQNISPVYDAGGTVAAIHGICHDITGRKRTEETLRKSQQQLSEAMDIASLVNWEYDATARLFTFDDRFYNLYGTTAEREGGMQMSPQTYAQEFVHPDDQHLLFREIEKLLKTTDPGYRAEVEHRIIRRDGEIRYIIARIGVVLDAEGRLIRTHGANQDITERRRLEEALRQSEEKFRSYVENANDIIYSLTPEGIFTYVSPRWTEVLGHDARDVLGKPIDLFLHPDDLPACHAFVRQVLDTGEKKGGIEYRIRHKDGTWQWHTTTASPLRDDAGSVVSFLGICRDITGRRRSEDAIRSANRQLTLLTGITRHDILNKVSVILGFLSFAEMKSTDPVISGYLEKIHAATTAVQSQIEFTRVYEDLGTHEPQWIDLSTILSRLHLPATIGLFADVKGLQILSDPMFEKVFFNLLDNSIRHGQQVTAIRISVHPSGGDMIVVWEDNGVGIAADEKEKIFERGFGKNTGLGLFLSREILTLTGITISETGDPSRGARFEIRVPKGVFRISAE